MKGFRSLVCATLSTIGTLTLSCSIMKILVCQFHKDHDLKTSKVEPRANSTELPAPKIIDFAKMSSTCLICFAPDPDLLMMGIGSIGTGAERR